MACESNAPHAPKPQFKFSDSSCDASKESTGFSFPSTFGTATAASDREGQSPAESKGFTFGSTSSSDAEQAQVFTFGLPSDSTTASNS